MLTFMKLIRSIFASSLLLLSFQPIFAQNLKMQWSPATEKATFLNCAMQKVKLKYPKGINASMQEWSQTFDAVAKACVKTGQQLVKIQFPSGFSVNAGFKEVMDSTFTMLIATCVAKVNYRGYLRWNKESDLHFQKELIKYFPKEMPEDKKKRCIDCIMSKLKQKYPDGISFTPEVQREYLELIKQWAEDCLKLLQK
jgi:hypothetical protein